MPKKEKDKKQGQAAKKAEADPLPQVWLPDQLEITGLSYGKGPRIDTSMVSSGNVLPPSKDEQDSMAKFWALEEANAPRGWEGEQELDYAEISSKRTAMERRYMEDSQNSAGGDPSLFSYAQTSYFTIKLLGHIPDVPPQSVMGSTESQISTLEAIDTAQRQGRVPWVTSPDDVRILSLSKYGVKVTDEKKQRVFSRHPLHCIANITYYEDTYSKHMVVFRTGQPKPGKNDLNELYVYQCNDESQAKDICLTLAQAFDAVHNKIKLEQNLHQQQ